MWKPTWEKNLILTLYKFKLRVMAFLLAAIHICSACATSLFGTLLQYNVTKVPNIFIISLMASKNEKENNRTSKGNMNMSLQPHCLFFFRNFGMQKYQIMFFQQNCQDCELMISQISQGLIMFPISFWYGL